MHQRPFVTEKARTLIRVLSFVCLFGGATLSLHGASFRLKHFGFGPINVETSLTILKTGSYLRATATNATDEPIESMRLCVLAMGVKGCLFEMWTSKPLAPGEEVSWDVSSKLLPPNIVHEMTVLSLERLSRPVLAQRTIDAAAPLLETRPAEARTLITRALMYDDGNAAAKDLSRTLEERSRQARQQLQMAQAAIRACNSQAAEEGLDLVKTWREFFPSEFTAVADEIAALGTARTAQQHWSQRAADTLTLVSQIERSSNAASCASTIAARLRGEVTAWQAAQTAEAQRQREAMTADEKATLAKNTKSGEAGNLEAQRWLAVAYASGDGASADIAEAARWLQKAAAQGDPWAMTSLAKLYQQGRGVPLSNVEAVSLFRKAAILGASEAQYWLARLLKNGIGTPQDYFEAHVWANLSAAGGDREAVALRDEIARLLPADRLTEAQAVAAAWQRGDSRTKDSGKHDLSLKKTGSGFAVSRDGFVVTNNHVVDGCGEVRLVDGPVGTLASVVAGDPAVDLALLKAERIFELTPSIRDKNPGLLDPVWIAGFPLNLRAFNITTGVVSSEPRDTMLFQYTAPTQFGNSGGPVLGRDGSVAGVVVSGIDEYSAQNVNFAIKVSILREFLSTHRAAFSTTNQPARTLEPSVLAERARRFTVLIECWK